MGNTEQGQSTGGLGTQVSPHVLLLALIVLCLLEAGVEAWTYAAGHDVAANAINLWNTIFALLVAWWVVADSARHPRVYKPFKFGWLVLVFLPFYLPYYLVRTRGALGLVWLLGFIVLFLLGWLLQIGLLFLR